MNTNLLEKYRSDRGELAEQIEASMSADTFDPADKDFVEARSRAESLDAKIKTIVDWQAQRNAANSVDAISVRSKSDRDEVQTREARPGSIGEAWTRSKAYTDYMQTPKGNSPSISLPWDLLSEQYRALIKLDSFTGVVPKERIAPSAAPASQTPLLDLISSVRVSQNSIEWVFFPAAAPLGTVTAEGAPKTEAAVTPSLVTVTLDTIASWAQYSRQFGEDAPGLVDFLNASLARGIMDKREAAAAAALVAASIPVTTNTSGTLLQGIRRAVGTVQAAGFRPQAVALNPADYASLDLEVMGKTLLGPNGNSSFWGIVPIPVGALASGTAYVGDFTTAMVELVRNDVQVYTTDSDITGAGATAASAFRSNILTTLVEARTKPIVQRPEALTKVAGTVTLLAADAQTAKK